MNDEKPLPQLPRDPLHGSGVLSVDARMHRGRLIKHFLKDVQDLDIQSRMDGWVYVLEEVLDEFGRHLSQSQCLESMKHAHVRRMRRALTRQEVDVGGQGKPLPPIPSETVMRLHKLMRRRSQVQAGENGHLLVCITPYGGQPIEDSGFHILPANIGCDFSPGSFVVQEDTVLYGLDGLEDGDEEAWRLVGGTFTFKGISQAAQYSTLRKVLRLAIYVHLSLLLEQHLLAAMHVHLTFPRPKLLTPFPSDPANASPSVPSPNEPRSRPFRTSLIPSSFTNFFVKRGFSYRSQTIDPPARRNAGSMDLTVISASPTMATFEAISKPVEGLSAAVSHLRLRRFSFMGERRFSHHQREPSHASEDQTGVWTKPFSVALKRIEECKTLLSTSPGVTFTPPKLIVDLTEGRKPQEDSGNQEHAKRRLKGDERVALTSVLGWQGIEAEGRGMSGILGFVRHQGISMLCSMHVPPPPAPPTKAPKAMASAPPVVVAASSTASTPSLESSPPNILDVSTTQTIDFTVVAPAPPQHLFFANLPQTGLAPCGKPHWRTYQYYSTRPEEDMVLGRWVQEYAATFDAPCAEPGCLYSKGKHECRLIHDGVRIVIRASHSNRDDEEVSAQVAEIKTEKGDKEDHNLTPVEPSEDIEVWESCAMCNAATPKKKLDAGAYLFSFAKFLELLLYSSSICNLTPQLCKHTSPPPDSGSGLPSSRLNIIRHFSVASIDITMSLSTIEDVFEIRVPRLQIIRGVERVTPLVSSAGLAETSPDGESTHKRLLRKEIRTWWQGVSEHIDKIELVLNADEPTAKTLPRLPSVDDAYEIFNTLESSQITTGRLPVVPHSTPNTPATGQSDYFAFATPSSISTATHESQTTTASTNGETDPEILLSKLRHNFQKIEQSLYSQLARTSDVCLNDVRRAFLATGRGTQKRLQAWQKKHLGVAKSKVVGELVAEEPEWWGKAWHVLPGVNVIVRDDDWGSIIAHTLSTTDYQLELANLSMVRTGSAGSQASPAPAESAPSSFFSVATGYKLFSSSSKNQPDPDQEDVVWNEPEQFSAVISRKVHPRDPTSILSIRNVLREKANTDPPASLPGASSRMGTLSDAPTTPTTSAQTSKSKPDVVLHTESVDGTLVSAPLDAAENASALISQVQKSLENVGTATATPLPISRPASIKSIANSSSNVELPAPTAVTSDSEPRRSTTPLTISTESDKSKDTIKKPQPAKASSSVSSHSVSGDTADSKPPPPPPKDTIKRLSTNGRPPAIDHAAMPSTSSTAPSAWKATPDTTQRSEPSTPLSTTSAFVSNLAHGINSAMRLVMPGREPLSRSPTPTASTMKRHHALLADITNFDERPHIKYDWTVGKRLKFSCTVYYAKQFDLLRKRYGIHDTFTNSLSRSANWAATGGKSKANFWKTADDQFIIKTLVDAWNVADLQVLIELAPSYFRYMDATASRATVLVKLLGFYTIEIRNLETGAVQSKVDLLVMENLFYKQNISKIFDLKGIQGRKVKSQGDTTKTLFDGEWIEGQQRTLTLIRPHSKAVLRDAIKSDAEFLAKSNIMDYSLLLGIDEEKKKISCGLVDTIGSFTFAKTLEYKAKQGLQSGKEVTVMPPAEYQERFVNALEGYFVACPDKWSKPFDENVKINSDPDLLPSVL